MDLVKKKSKIMFVGGKRIHGRLVVEKYNSKRWMAIRVVIRLK